jgi:hypothetical protein
MSFSYPYQQGPDSWVDELGENGGTMFLNCQSSIGRAISYQNSNYRTILSSVIFGALTGAQQDALIAKYMEYLSFSTGINEQKVKLEKPIFTINPNPASNHKVIKFNITGKADNLTIFDASGRTVTEWILNPENENPMVWSLTGKSIANGTYFARLTGSGFVKTQSFVIVR